MYHVFNDQLKNNQFQKLDYDSAGPVKNSLKKWLNIQS